MNTNIICSRLLNRGEEDLAAAVEEVTAAKRSNSSELHHLKRLIMKLPVQARKAVNKQLRTLIKKKASTADFKKFAAALNKLVSKHGGKPHKVTRRKVPPYVPGCESSITSR